MSHPFGDLVRQHLSRKHGLSQNKLASGITQDPAVIARMLNGQRLTGPHARERVIAIIVWLSEQGVLKLQEEANTLLQAAGMAGLNADQSEKEAALLKVLRERSSTEQQEQHAGHSKLHYGSAPLCPTLIIGREEALHELKVRLMDTKRDEDSAQIQLLTAIRGWPGIGKTTLAAALAYDTDIALAFPDGILWASLGPDPNVFAELTAWGRALGVEDVIRVGSIKEASLRLAALLRGKRVLLIIDDVWQAEHVIPFKLGGRNCAILITTRRLDVAQALAPTIDYIYKLPVLTDDNALELLQALAPSVVARYSDASRELVEALEGLPLALQVAGRLLAAEEGYGWGIEELLTELRTGVKLLEAQAPADIAELATATAPTVAVLLERSTACLDSSTRTCFARLGAFVPKPASFDFAALQAVWAISDPKPIVRMLIDRGLLEHIGSTRYQLHALLAMHARSLLRSATYDRLV